MPNVLKESARGIERIRIDDELFNNREIFLTDFSCPIRFKNLNLI